GSFCLILFDEFVVIMLKFSSALFHAFTGIIFLAILNRYDETKKKLNYLFSICFTSNFLLLLWAISGMETALTILISLIFLFLVNQEEKKSKNGKKILFLMH
ncbi:MAG: hypothetical protein ACFFDN_36840, partial [Candidatus Hodarchaeota archaeon]